MSEEELQLLRMRLEQLEQENAELRYANSGLGGNAHRLLEMAAILNDDHFENSPIPMSDEDWSAAKRIADRLTASGVDDIRDYVQENPSLLAELAPAVKILNVNPAAVKTYKAKSRQELLAAFNAPPDLNTYNPMTGLSDIFVELIHRFAKGETHVVLEGPDTALDGSVIYIRTTTKIDRGREHDWGRVIQTVQDFTALLPHVQNSLLLREKFIALINQHRTIEGLLNSLTTPSLLVDRNGVVVELNEATERILATSQSLSLVRGKISAHFVDDEKRLIEAIRACVAPRQVCSPEGLQSHRVQISHASSDRPYTLLICPLPRFSYSLDAEVAAVIYISDPEKLKTGDAVDLSNFYGLTQSEQLLCAHLLKGLSLIEAAKALRITQGTARQRLKTIFRKTDTNGQADLIRLMMTYIHL